MPLLPDGTVVCLQCHRSFKVKDKDWLLPEDDPSAFTTPPCPGCGAQESYFWHDEIYTRQVSEERELPPEIEGGPPRAHTVQWEEPDPEHFHARHMRSIERVAEKLGRKQRSLKPPRSDGRAAAPLRAQVYEVEPAELTAQDVVEYAESVKPRPVHAVATTRADADEHHRAVRDAAEKEMKERTAALHRRAGQVQDAKVAAKAELRTAVVLDESGEIPAAKQPTRATKTKLSEPVVDKVQTVEEALKEARMNARKHVEAQSKKKRRKKR